MPLQLMKSNKKEESAFAGSLCDIGYLYYKSTPWDAQLTEWKIAALQHRSRASLRTAPTI